MPIPWSDLTRFAVLYGIGAATIFSITDRWVLTGRLSLPHELYQSPIQLAQDLTAGQSS